MGAAQVALVEGRRSGLLVKVHTTVIRCPLGVPPRHGVSAQKCVAAHPARPQYFHSFTRGRLRWRSILRSSRSDKPVTPTREKGDQVARADQEAASGEKDGVSGAHFKASTTQDAVVDWQAAFLPFLFPALGGALFGYDIGATSGAVISLKDAALSGTDWYALSPLATGLVVSGSLAGALGGSLAAYGIAEPLGRRGELLLASAFYLCGSLTMGLAPALPVLIIGKVLYGLGIGLAMHAAPMYIAETAPPSIRGTLISLKEGLVVGGILLGYLVGYTEINEVGGWRWMLSLAAPASLLMGVGMFCLPYSPRWLLRRAVGREADDAEAARLRREAKVSLQRLSGRAMTEARIDEQIHETEAALLADQKASPTAVGLHEVLSGTSLQALIIGGGLVFFQQVTGQPSVLYYAASILQDAGFSAASDATFVAVGLGLFKLLMTGVAVVSVDRVGRRPLLLTGVTGIVLSLLSLTAFYLTDETFPALSVGALLVYVGSYQVSFGPISWLVVSEIFPLRVRGQASSVASLINFGSNAAVALSLPPVEAAIGQANTFSLFALIGLAALAFIYVQVPETKGLSLEEIEDKLALRSSAS